MAMVQMAGCSSQTTNTTATATTAATRYVEELKVGTTKACDNFNIAADDGSFQKMNTNSFCVAPFIEYDETGELLPNIMTDWEILEDQKSMIATFATDKGITWHDGQPLTMADIVFTWDYLKNVLKIDKVDELVSFEKIDDTRLKMYFKTSAYAFLMSIPTTEFVYPKHIWENITEPKTYTGADATIGCGPYKYVGCDKDAQTMYFEAVDNYFKGELTVKKVSVRSFDNHDSLIMALKNGEIDAMYDYSNSLDASAAPSITGIEGLDPGMSQNISNYQLVFGFNKTPTNELQFRKAVSCALDYSLLATAIGGEAGEIPGIGIISPPNVGFDSSLPKLKQDVALAKSTLEAAGYKDINNDGYRELPTGETMNVMVNPQFNKTKAALYLRIAEIIMKNLDAVGVKTTLDEQCANNSDYFMKVRKEGTYELFIGYTSPVFAHYKTAFFYMVQPLDNNKWGTCNIQEVVDAYKGLRTASSTEEYISYAKTLQKLAGEDVFGLALCWDKAYFPYRTDKYEGWVNYPGWGVINNKTWYNVVMKS